MKVGELIKELRKLDKNLEVGVEISDNRLGLKTTGINQVETQSHFLGDCVVLVTNDATGDPN